jgi:hypothetical protein
MAKIVAYTPEMIASMTEAYVAAPSAATVAALAAEFGKSTKSVVAKLAQLGVYRKAEKAAAEKAGDTKAAIAARIAGEDAEFASDLAKLTKASLAKIEALKG